MIPRRAVLIAALALTALAGLSPARAGAADAPAWALTLTPLPGAFVPDSTPEYLFAATNVGSLPTTSDPVRMEVTLPDDISLLAFNRPANTDPGSTELPECEKVGVQKLICETAEAVHPGFTLGFLVTAEVPASKLGQTIEAQAAVSGGGALALSTTVSTPVQSEPPKFDFLPGAKASFSQADGAPLTQASAHPNQWTLYFEFPTENIAGALANAGHPRDVTVELPHGLVGNPPATPVLCTEAQLITEIQPGCPPASQIGVVDLTTLLEAEEGEGNGGGQIFTSNLYNMVPPPGSPAEIGFDAAKVGIFVHFLAALRSDSDFGVDTFSNDLLALGLHPIFGAQTQVWGDPAAASHDRIRGLCLNSATIPPCKVDPPQKSPFLTLPGDCPGAPPSVGLKADSWEVPGVFARTKVPSGDLSGNTLPMEGCESVLFDPDTGVKTQPDDLHSDSPTGLDVTLHQPTEVPHTEPLTGQAPATLKDITLTLPKGLDVNASQAAGLGACAEAEIGFEPEEGQIRFNHVPQSCPDAAKIGTLEASSPLLAEYDEEHEVQRDPVSEAAIPRPLHGSVFLAQPFQNPFGSLVAIYLAIEDEKSGIVAKLAGEGKLDPVTGQISTTFTENPELPLEDFHVHIFGGDRGALITPPTCVPHQATAALTPWSAPQAPDITRTDSITPASGPGGSPCPTSESQMPFAPALEAGTVSPQAGKYSPLVFDLSRQDGSQRLARLEAALPPGLTAKLAGVGQCSDADIAKAISREAPNKGAEELADPSCPAASQVGVVEAATGAGPSPYRVSGRAYLAGPYEGAPLSLVVITPAIAGPFDLGAVVIRAAVRLDPETAQPRAVSDPLPQILDGVPVNLREVTMTLNRSEFSLNPTSCDEKSFSGTATSTLGATAPLSERFQASSCKSLPYKPKLSARLFGPTNRGAHPRLRAIFTARPGEAGTARVSFALPHSEFIDQAHFRTICTRVQFAANACPKGAIYGHVKAITPLVDYPLEGPIYLRSSVHKLPDVVAVLRGPPSQPIEVDAVARVDSVNGGVRTTFESVPDAPITKVIVTMQGAKKGLFQNSTNLCKGTHRATLLLDGQNGKTHDTRPVLKASCPKHKKHKKHKKKGGGAGHRH